MGEAFTAYPTHAGAAIENLARFRTEVGETPPTSASPRRLNGVGSG
jgi:hypothetical protein